MAAAGIILNQFEVVGHYLQLPHDLHLTQLIGSWADHLLSHTIGETRTQAFVVGAFWAAVGLIVYVFLRGIAKLFVELDDDLQAERFVWPKGADRRHPLRVLEEEVIFRAGAIIGLLIMIFGPLAAVLRGPVFVEFLGSGKVLQYIVWFMASVIVWHVIIILLRLIALRARLF